MDNFTPKFVPHDRLSDSTGKRNVGLTNYRARVAQLNQIACRLELLPFPPTTGDKPYKTFLALSAVQTRLQKIHLGVEVDSPNWSSLVQAEDSQNDCI